MKYSLIALSVVGLALVLFSPASFWKSTADKAHALLFSHMHQSGMILCMSSFSKEEKVAFDEVVAGFEDALVLSKEVALFRTDATSMERSSNQIWRPQPYIAQSFDGLDQSANFKNYTQLSVPASIGYSKSVPWEMSAAELNDALQEGRLGQAAKQKLASDVNVAVANVASLQGTLVVKRTAAASGFDDVAECDALLSEQGVQRYDRKLALYSRHYNKMASNLAGRANMQGKPSDAYEKGYVGVVSGFTSYEADYTYRLTAAAGVTCTVTSANQRYVPKATSTAATGETSNVDNRYQVLPITVTSGTVKVGDCFTIAGVNAVHHITKQDTGQPKTFRVIGIISGSGGTGTIQISPPIIAADSAPTDAELQYKNVTAAPAAGAAITWLNTVADNVSPFWVKDAIELLPGRYSPAENAGLAIMRATTENGIEILMTKQAAIGDLKAKFRMDVRFGVNMLQPEMAGIMLFSQT